MLNDYLVANDDSLAKFWSHFNFFPSTRDLIHQTHSAFCGWLCLVFVFRWEIRTKVGATQTQKFDCLVVISWVLVADILANCLSNRQTPV